MTTEMWGKEALMNSALEIVNLRRYTVYLKQCFEQNPNLDIVALNARLKNSAFEHEAELHVTEQTPKSYKLLKANPKIHNVFNIWGTTCIGDLQIGQARGRRRANVKGKQFMNTRRISVYVGEARKAVIELRSS